MLFNSYVFICLFMPITLAGYALFGRINPRLAAVWLSVCSLFFYAWWNPVFLIVLCGSILGNFALGEAILASDGRERQQGRILFCGIAANLALLFFYKYVFALIGFFVSHEVLPASWSGKVALPLGISFFTFTQIGYLMDCRQRVVRERSFVDYVLFVTFFPHLIAGPIIHHKEMMPQFAARETYHVTRRNIAIGLTLFVVGLAKKVLIADRMIPTVAAVFSDPVHADVVVAWLGLLSYSLQLYFDFSGYSDMAIGLARMFGIRFPVNFNSPYKARSIIDFWQRWHMTLTRYLNLLLFNPIAMAMTRRRLAKGLGISRKAIANPRAFLALTVWPTMATMALAGVWHGAGLQFLVFGLPHGLFLSINHAWRMFGPKGAPHDAAAGGLAGTVRNAGLVLLTYAAVLVGQVFFRAGSVGDGVAMLKALAGLHEPGRSPSELLYYSYLDGAFLVQAAFVVGGLLLVWFTPNSQEWLRDFEPALAHDKAPPATGRRLSTLKWTMSPQWAMVVGGLAALAFASLSGPTEFLYFEF
ncbi:MAG TPA: MBOAT family O-acyltransferase [Novosphingobium sp.]